MVESFRFEVTVKRQLKIEFSVKHFPAFCSPSCPLNLPLVNPSVEDFGFQPHMAGVAPKETEFETLHAQTSLSVTDSNCTLDILINYKEC